MVIGGTIVPNAVEQRNILNIRSEVLQELERHGYIAECLSGGLSGRVIYRHPSAPSLLVCDDGRLELVSDHLHAQGMMTSPQPVKRIHWDRAVVVIALLGFVSFLGLLVVAMVVG